MGTEILSSLAAAAGGGVTAGTREKCESSALVKNDKCAAFTTSENRMPICADVRARQCFIKNASKVRFAALQHWQSTRLRTAWKRRIQCGNFLCRQHEITRCRIFASM